MKLQENVQLTLSKVSSSLLIYCAQVCSSRRSVSSSTSSSLYLFLSFSFFFSSFWFRDCVRVVLTRWYSSKSDTILKLTKNLLNNRNAVKFKSQPIKIRVLMKMTSFFCHCRSYILDECENALNISQKRKRQKIFEPIQTFIIYSLRKKVNV